MIEQKPTKETAGKNITIFITFVISLFTFSIMIQLECMHKSDKFIDK